MSRLLLPLAALGAAVAIPASAQVSENSGTSAPLPRDETPAPPGSPRTADCKRKACIFLVNVSGYRVTDLRYAMKREANGGVRWSENQFATDFDFHSKRWTAWFRPKDLGCLLALKIAMNVDGRKVEESAEFDTCTNPTLLFYIRDPREKQGRVFVDPAPVDPPKAIGPGKP